MKTQQELFEYLKRLSIETQTYYHEPLFTVEQAEKTLGQLPGAHVKNLFLKDDKKQLWLIVAEAHTAIKLKEIAKALEAPGLRFANENLLKEYLGVLPGSVTPFGIINDTEQKVTVILDSKLFNYELVNVHPLVNTATTALSPNDLQRFITACGNKLIFITFNNF